MLGRSQIEKEDGLYLLCLRLAFYESACNTISVGGKISCSGEGIRKRARFEEESYCLYISG